MDAYRCISICVQMDTGYIWFRVGLNLSPSVHLDGYAHPGWSTTCAHCCALDTPAAWLRSSLRSTRDTARCRRAASCRLCSCGRAHSTLHGTAGIGHTCTTLASMRMQPVHVQDRRIGGTLERNRAASDAEDGVPVSAVTDESDNTPLASLAPTAARRAWQLANSASQLVTPDASWGVILAWHTTPNVVSTTRIAARPLQRKRDECAATTANPLICDERADDRTRGAGSMMAIASSAAYS
jgi:hypothetical protein